MNCWLNKEKTLSYYDLKPGDIIEYKIKHTLMKIQFLGPWPTVKTFLLDESKTVGDLSIDIASKLSIPNSHEFSLQKEGEEGIWLDPKVTLSQQQIDSLCSTLLFRKKYFYSEYNEKEINNIINECENSENGITMLNRIFCETIDGILGGTNPCTLNEAIKLSGLQCQIKFGDNISDKSFFETLNWKHYLPCDYLNSIKKIEKDIYLEYKLNNGINDVNGKLMFLKQARMLKTYGYTFFKVDKLIKENQLIKVLFGVSKTSILILDPNTKDIITSHALPQIIQWKVMGDTITLYFLEHSEEYCTKESKDISQVIMNYIQFTYQQITSSNSNNGNNSISVHLSPRAKERLKQLMIINKGIINNNNNNNNNSNNNSNSNNNTNNVGNNGISISNNNGNDDITNYGNNNGNNSNVVKSNSKKSPFYVNPNKVHINPLFVGHTWEFATPTDEMSYYMKMLRSLSCLKNSLCAIQCKERTINVKFSDKNIKKFVVDENKTVYDITLEIAEQVGIKNTTEFSLQREEGEVWLNPYQVLRDQLINNNNNNNNTILLFKKKFHYNDAFVNNNDPVYFNLLFCQLQESVTSGLYGCDINQAVQLAATQFQINFGDYNPTIHTVGFLQLKDLKFFLPPECLDFWGVTFQKLEKMIYREHQKLRGIKEEYAKYRYLQLCRNLRAYGTVCFQVKLLSHKGNSNISQLPSIGFLLGFSRDSFVLLTLKTKKVILEYPLTHVRKWETTTNSFTIDCGDYPEGIFTFKTIEGEIISKYLSDYLDFIQKTVMATQTFNVQICQYPPSENNFFISELTNFCTWENGKRVFTSSFV